MIYRQKNIYPWNSFIWTVMLILTSLNASAQVNNYINNGSLAESIKIKFAEREIIIVKGQIISNVIKVVNTSSSPLSFYANLNYPASWKTLFNTEKKYTVFPNDSLFIPVRLIPDVLMYGNTKYYINIFIEDENRNQVATDFFFASTKKISSWILSVNPESRIYFRNNENETNFNVSVFNSGNEKQDLMLTFTNPRSNLIVMDTTGKAITDFKHDFALKPMEDTSFSYKVKYIDGERNFKNIDLENYNPVIFDQDREFSLYFHSEEPRRFSRSNISRSSRVNFMKIGNIRKVNPYGSDVIPLSAYLRVSNLLDDIVFSSLHLRGQKYFANGGMLLYNTSLYFSSQQNFYKEKYVRNIPWYVGYFDAKKSVQVGYINGGAIGIQSSGKGIKGEYNFIPDHWAGAYFIRSPYFFSDDRLQSWGINYRYEGINFSVPVHFAHSNHKIADIKTNVVSISPQIRILKKHSLGATVAFSGRYNYHDPLNTDKKIGYLAGLGYTSQFFNHIWKLNVRSTYSSKGFGSYGFERWLLSHHSTVALSKDFSLVLTNNYNQYNYDPAYYNYIPGYDINYYLFNSLNLYSPRYFASVKPGIFYDIRYNLGYNFHSRGLNLAFSNYDIQKNLQASVISTIGLAKIVNEPGSTDHFFYKLNAMIRYHNISFTGFYNYGPLSPAMVHIVTDKGIMPQSFRASVVHQLMFKNRHIVLETSVSYMYTNIYNHHSFNLSPELYYFTKSGWRFSVNPTYTYYSSKYTTDYTDLPDYVVDKGYEFQRYSHDNIVISAGIKKDFGIPLPTTFGDYSNMEFVTFYDVNGNKKQDNEEPGIENVLIRTGDWNLITTTSGNAILKNANNGKYPFSVMSLEDLQGWFPLNTDSLVVFGDEKVWIPFVKGVKIYGSVFIDLDEINPAEKKTDISGIKITAVNGETFSTLTGSDGTFEFYLPFGDYTITLDETILNGRYFILKNNYKIDLTGEVDNMYITFHILEKKRKVRVKKFESNGTHSEE
jgi:hypothetical protein